MPRLARRASIARGAASRAVIPSEAKDAKALSLEAGLVHHLHGLVDRKEPTRKARVEHLREGVLALASDHVARLADEVFLALLALHQLGEVRRVGTSEVLHVGLDASLQVDGLDP